MKHITLKFVLHFYLIVIGVIFIILTIINLFEQSTAFENESQYPYFNKERKIEMKDVVDPSTEKVKVDWYLWFDGEISGSGTSEWMPVYSVKPYKVKLNNWANEKIRLMSQLKQQ